MVHSRVDRYPALVLKDADARRGFRRAGGLVRKLREPFLTVTALLFAAGALAQTAGFIYARPTCVPPTTIPGGQVRDTVNYLQGPKPILLAPGGDITILTNDGQCCEGHWEAVFSLLYPHVGPPAQFAIWGQNDFGNDLSRNEFQAGFPTALFSGGEWRIAYSPGFTCNPSVDPSCSSLNYTRVGRIDLPNLTTRALPSQVTNQWILPNNPSCQALGSCGSAMAGVMPSFIAHPDGTLYVYSSDSTGTGGGACPSGWTRHLVNTNMSIPHVTGDGCLTFDQAPKNPVYLDIARASDGSLYALTDGMPNLGYVVEWRSIAEPSYLSASCGA